MEVLDGKSRNYLRSKLASAQSTLRYYARRQAYYGDRNGTFQREIEKARGDIDFLKRKIRELDQ